MLEKENLTPFQIQLLLYYLTAEPSKRTVTDSARSLNVSKWVGHSYAGYAGKAEYCRTSGESQNGFDGSGS